MYPVPVRHILNISIHAPAEGATPQPELFGLRVVISIHAPAEGATRFNNSCKGSKNISIHAPAEGATPEAAPMAIVSLFQSTLPRRERPMLPI